MPKVLSGEQVRDYQQDGLVFPIPVLSAAEVATARAALDELVALGGHTEIMRLRHLQLFHGLARNLALLAARYVATEAWQQLDHYPLILARGQDRFGNYRILEELPSVTLEEAIQAQADLYQWVLDSRASSVPVPLPPSCRLKWKEASNGDTEVALHRDQPSISQSVRGASR